MKTRQASTDQNTSTESPLFEGKELYVLLSNRCNFSCAHCLNDSGPQAKTWNPTSGSLESLAAEINGCREIELLNFSGGEPTLFLTEIQHLLESIDRPIAIAITTNGWFANRSVHYLDDLPLKQVVLSYDRFHASFISLEELIPLVRHLQSRQVEVSFNFVFSKLEDLADLAPIEALGVAVHTSRIVKSGRASHDSFLESKWQDTQAIHQTCPSLNPSQRRTTHLEKVIYLSEKGFTPCCGPLVFNELCSQKTLFSASLTDYSNNVLRQELSKGTFAEQGKRLGIDLSQISFQSPCEACALLYGEIASGLPSIAQVLYNPQNTMYLPFQDSIARNQELLLLQKYMVGYTETLEPSELRKSIERMDSSDCGIAVVPLTPENRAQVIEFVKGNYYDTHARFCPPALADQFVRAAPEYFDLPRIRGQVYFKAGEFVGVIFTNPYDSHPALQVPTLHIGYWGYDRSALSQEEARWIKRHWLSSLLNWSEGNRIIDASFDYFNASALRFARSIGFERRMLRLNRMTV